MNCASIRQVLEQRFDAGEALEPLIQVHLTQCPDCAAHQRALEALDAELCRPPAIDLDAALVARIQASIAAQPRHRASRWAPVAGMVGAIAALIVTGWYIDVPNLQTGLDRSAWSMQEPLLPSWSVLQQEFAALPEAIVRDTNMVVTLARQGWTAASGTVGVVVGENGTVLWAAFVVCLLGAGMSNGLEIITRNTRRPRN